MMSLDNLVNADETLVEDIKAIIERNKQKAVIQVNQVLIFTYWQIGKIIRTKIILANPNHYGNATLQRLSSVLVSQYGAGFSARNLTKMAKFYQIFPDESILPTLSAKLSWSHFVELLKIEDTVQRDFYITLAQHERWSVRTLRERIDSMLFERTALAKQPDELIYQELSLLTQQQPSPQIFLKDPYILDFLQLDNTPSEKDLENAILQDLEKFILEFGTDFAFLGRQKRISIGNQDYYIDLLFYHRSLKCLIVIELKLGEFKAEYKGQVELYLKWLEKYETRVDENPPIGIILCSGKDNEVVELLDLDPNRIHIADYWLQLPSKDILQNRLHHAIEKAQLRISQQN